MRLGTEGCIFLNSTVLASLYTIRYNIAQNPILLRFRKALIFSQLASARVDVKSWVHSPGSVQALNHSVAILSPEPS